MDTPATPTLDADTATRIIKQLEKAIEDRDDSIAEIKYENSEMRDQSAQMRLDYETRIETLQAQFQQLSMEKEELQARFDDANDRLTELHGNEQEMEAARKERHDAILQLQRMESENLRMTEEIAMLHNENEQIRSNLKDAQSNLSKLQTSLITMKKQKSEVEGKFSKYMEDQRAREEALNIEIEDLEARLDEVNRQSEALRQNVIASEQEKIKMQSDFTQATMDLITNDLNEDQDKHNKQSTMRLSALTSEDVRGQSMRQRTDSQFSVVSDAEDHNRNDSMQFVVQHRMGSGSIAAPEGDSLLEEMKDRYHGRADSQLSIDSEAGSGRPRHSRTLSVGATSDAVLQKLRVFMSRELIGQIKAMLGEELKHIDVKEQLDGVPEKLETMLKQVVENQAEMKANGSGLNQESLNNILGQFETKVKESLNETLNKMNENGSNVDEIKKGLEETLDQLGQKLETPSDSLKATFEETLRDQMEAMQISMENQIDSSINNSIQQSMTQHVGSNIQSSVESSINTNIKQPLETIHETVEKIYELQQKYSSKDPNNINESDKDEYNKLIEDLGNKMESLLSNNNTFEESMQDRIDKFMETFRKEVIPEFQAMFEQMDLSALKNNGNGNGIVDDEKYDENKNKYEIQIDNLNKKIDNLQLKCDELSIELKDAATSKASSLLRLQNLIDHLRFDNRVLQQKLERYQLQDAIYEEMEINDRQNKSSSSWGFGSIMGGVMNSVSNIGRNKPRVIHVNVSNMQNRDYNDIMGNVTQASNAAAEYTANAAVNVVARAVAAGVNEQNVST